jgi:hypothetical protein
MNRRALTLTDQSRSGQPAALAGGVDLSSALPASNCTTQIVSVREAAIHFDVDKVTIRRNMRNGCPGCRTGRRGPGNGGLVDLQQMAIWLGRASVPVEQTREDTMLKIAQALLRSLTDDHCDVSAGVNRADAAAVLIAFWQSFCKTMGKSYRCDQCLEPIRTLMSEL